mmetsp:Transcript_51291/g.147253  ORF Transcript_51291/g.147253 Transcript_51291/m.147253 type:complete len:231 (-) Transcript_51291:210-902(-)
MPASVSSGDREASTAGRPSSSSRSTTPRAKMSEARVARPTNSAKGSRYCCAPADELAITAAAPLEKSTGRSSRAPPQHPSRATAPASSAPALAPDPPRRGREEQGGESEAPGAKSRMREARRSPCAKPRECRACSPRAAPMSQPMANSGLGGASRSWSSTLPKTAHGYASAQRAGQTAMRVTRCLLRAVACTRSSPSRVSCHSEEPEIATARTGAMPEIWPGRTVAPSVA